MLVRIICAATSALFLTAVCSLQAGAQSFTSSNLPVIVIQTNGVEIPNEPKITAQMGISYNSNGQRNAVTGPFTHYNGPIGIEIRGQSSQMFPMKSYSIELRDAAGASADKSLFGLPKESDWVLYAPYTDKTLMRNFMAYTLSRQMGRWAANCRFVELIVNNDYKGIYVFMEKIKRNSARVNIPKIAVTDVAGDALTGGYIFSIDKEPNGWFSKIPPNFSSKGQRIQFSYVYPKPENITPPQQDYIAGYVDSFEAALQGPQFQHPVQGWRRFADETSFIDFSFINEISKNVDGYRLSSYFHKDRNGKIHAGPVWDFDLAFRNADYCRASDIIGFASQFNQVCIDSWSMIPFWWDRLQADTAYQANVRCRWFLLRESVLSSKNINGLIDSVVGLTAEARDRHFRRWPVLGQYVWPNPQPIAATYEQEIVFLKQWLEQRLNWLDGAMPNTGRCYRFPAGETRPVMIQAYPNPFTQNVTVNMQSRTIHTAYVQISDVSGRMLFSQSYNLTPGEFRVTLPASHWKPGMYVLHYRSSLGQTGAVKLLKTN